MGREISAYCKLGSVELSRTGRCRLEQGRLHRACLAQTCWLQPHMLIGLAIRHQLGFTHPSDPDHGDR